MPSTRHAPEVNRLLEARPNSELLRILGGCERIELAFGEVLYTPGERLKHVYFPIGGFISLIVKAADSASLEVGLIGDGMFGSPLALGVDVSPVRAVVRGAGSAFRMDAAFFCRELERSQALQGSVASCGCYKADCESYARMFG